VVFLTPSRHPIIQSSIVEILSFPSVSYLTSLSLSGVALLGEKWNLYRVLVGEPEGKRQLGKPRRRWENNIKMDLKDIGWGGSLD
jgi:hypothetical protein